jgi:hypothetical protein
MKQRTQNPNPAILIAEENTPKKFSGNNGYEDIETIVIMTTRGLIKTIVKTKKVFLLDFGRWTSSGLHCCQFGILASLISWRSASFFL